MKPTFSHASGRVDGGHNKPLKSKDGSLRTKRSGSSLLHWEAIVYSYLNVLKNLKRHQKKRRGSRSDNGILR